MDCWLKTPKDDFLNKILTDRNNVQNQVSPLIMFNMTATLENVNVIISFIELGHTMETDALHIWPLHDYGPLSVDSWIVERKGWTFHTENNF